MIGMGDDVFDERIGRAVPCQVRQDDACDGGDGDLTRKTNEYGHAGLGQDGGKAFFGNGVVKNRIGGVQVTVKRHETGEIAAGSRADDDALIRHRSQSPFLPNIFFSMSAIGPVAGNFG